MRRTLLSIMLFGVATSLLAQDPVRLTPSQYKVLLENERVRVLDFQDKPGDKSIMHSHPDAVRIVLAPSKRKLTRPDGTTVTREAKAGEVGWNPAQAHAGENVGHTNTHVLFVELKERCQ